MAPDLTFIRPRTTGEVVAADRAIPALGDVLDLDRLTARLAAATGAPGRLSRPYLRYKPGTSVVLSCRWTAADGPRDLLVRAYADGSRGKLDKGLAPHRPDEVLLLDRGAALVVSGWVADRQLPAARDAADLAADLVGRPAGPRLLRHNPERRAVLYARGPRGEALVRVVRPDAVARAAHGYALLGAVSEGTAGAGTGTGSGVAVVRVPRLRSVDTDRGVVVTDWVPGRSLDRLDAAGALDEAALRDVGALAAALHGARPAGAGLPPRPDGAVPLHGDLSLDQLVRSPGGELWLVDADAARWGRPAEDLGSLAAALVRAHGAADAAAARLAAVLDGYAAAGAGPVAEPELRAAVAEHLRRRATEPFRRLEPGWAATSAALRELADDVDDGRGGALGAVLTGRTRGGAATVRPAVRPEGSASSTAVAETPAGPASGRAPHLRTAPVAAVLAEALAAQGHVLRAVLPRSADRLLVVGTDRDGRTLAGRWDAGPGIPPTRGAGTRTDGDPAHARGPVPVGGGALVLHPDGADPRLPGLGDRVRAGATLVAHRSGRRGVVRDPAGTYTKVTRPGREPAGVAVPAAAFATPKVLERGDGFVTTSPLPGRTLHELLRDRATPDAVLDPVLDAAGRGIGRGLRRLQDGTTPGVPEHDADAEVAVVARWWGLAAAHGATTPADADAVVRRVRAALADAPVARPVLTHRDLHDKQLLVHVDGDEESGGGVRIGLLDLDLAAVAHPALDLANLLVHLELRAHQGVCPPERAARVARAVVDGYGEGFDGGALRVWAVAARARLAAVYAFRPAPGDVPGALLTDLDRPLPFEPALLTLEDR